MGQRVSVTLVDDIDGSDADETVRFGIDGVDYEVDLNSAHAADLRSALALYIGHGRKVGGRRGRGRRSTSASSSRVAGNGATPAAIREWARANGWKVSDRGRVPAEVREAYAAAH